MSKEENNINENEEINSEAKELLSKEENQINGCCKSSLIKRIFAGVIDQLITLSISGIALIIFDFVIKFAGYKVSMPLGILMIFYFIANVLYMPIMDRTKLEKSIGKRILNIK